MILVDASQLTSLRRRQAIQGPCSLQLEHHTWAAFILPNGWVRAVICVRCGLFPLEVMGLWPMIA